MKKRIDLRLVDIPPKVFDKLKKNAAKEKRTLNKQALVHIENDLKNTK